MSRSRLHIPFQKDFARRSRLTETDVKIVEHLIDVRKLANAQYRVERMTLTLKATLPQSASLVGSNSSARSLLSMKRLKLVQTVERCVEHKVLTLSKSDIRQAERSLST